MPDKPDSDPTVGSVPQSEPVTSGPVAADRRWSSTGGAEISGPAVPARDRPDAPRWPDVLVVVGLTLVAALAAALGFFHLAWRWGTASVPVSPIVLAAIVWVLCRMAFRLTGAVRMAALPWAGCLVVVVFLFFADNPGFSLPLRVVTMNYETNQATDGNWRGLLLLGVLVLTAAVQLSLLWATSVSARVARQADPPWPAGPVAPSGVSDPSAVGGTPDGVVAPAKHVTPTTSGASGGGVPGTGVDTGS